MAKKDRISVPEDVVTVLMFESDRTCCVCHERGRPIQIHHIDENPSNNDPFNLAILCFICHDETQITGGFSRKLDAAQVSYFRNDWHQRVKARRDAADAFAVARKSGQGQAITSTTVRQDSLLEPTKLANYMWTLPAVRKDIYGRAQSKWDSGITTQMKRGSYEVIDVSEQTLITLATWYPQGHFGGRDPKDYVNAMTAARFAWHKAHLEPTGAGTGGTIIGTMVAGRVMSDLERMIVDVISSLASKLADFDFTLWKQWWDTAYPPSNQGSSATLGEVEENEVIRVEDYARRILGRWLGPRKYTVFHADGRWGVQRNEDAPIEISGRRWRIEGNKLIWTFVDEPAADAFVQTIITFTAKQFVTEIEGSKKTYDWAP